MAVEPTNENESAAAPQETAPGAMLTDEDLESPAKKRKVCCKIMCTLMCMFAIVQDARRAGLAQLFLPSPACVCLRLPSLRAL